MVDICNALGIQTRHLLMKSNGFSKKYVVQNNYVIRCDNRNTNNFYYNFPIFFLNPH